MKKKIFYFFLFFTNRFFSNLLGDNENISIWTWEQPLGVTFSLEYIHPILRISQKDINNKKLSSGNFLPQEKRTKENLLLIFKFLKEYGGLKQEIKVYKDKMDSSILQVIKVNQKKEKDSYKTNNLYYFLPDLLNQVQLNLNSKPDYYAKENEIILQKPELKDIYKIYYAYNNKYRIYNKYTYINEQVNWTMGQILEKFNNPAFYFIEGNGNVLFIYLGVHVCNQKAEKNKKIKEYHGILILSFDIYNICRNLVYKIQKCPNCHKDYKGSFLTDDDLFFFKIETKKEELS